MKNSFKRWWENLQSSDLEPIVSRVIDHPKVDVLDWHITSFSGGASEHVGLGLGVYRVSGSARCNGREVSWTSALKVFGPSDTPDHNSPSHLNYWKRELLAYKSGVVEDLPGKIAAPRCYAVQELPDDLHCVWLEIIHDSVEDWDLSEHYLAAHHLGQFNGAYLTGHPLPVQAEWMLSGRTRLLADRPKPDVEKLMTYCKTDFGRWLTPNSINRMDKLWMQREALVAALGRLPTCFCHHDAFRRNLMLGKTEDGATKVTAIDWAFVGRGKIGEEIGTTLSVDLLFMEVPAKDAQELSQAVFSGYCDGLRDAGWQGDFRLARFGYVVTASLGYGLEWGAGVANAMQQPGAEAIAEAITGHPVHQVVEQYTEVLPFLLDCGDEALELLESM